MTIGEYTFFEQPGSTIVEWMEPVLPIEIKVISLLLLATMPLLLLFRVPFAHFADRHLHIHGSPRLFGTGAVILSLAGGILLLFVKEPRTAIYWNFGNTGVSVKSPNGTAGLKWSDVDVGAYDDKSPEPATLTLKSKDGKTVWLVLSWMEPLHQEKVVAFINKATNNKFNLAVLPREETETEDDEPLSPIESRIK